MTTKTLRQTIVGALVAYRYCRPAPITRFATPTCRRTSSSRASSRSVKMRNPHMALTLVESQADGSKRTINFVEGDTRQHDRPHGV